MGSARTQLWDFVETLERASTGEAVGEAFLAESLRLGFEHVGLITLGDPFNPPPRGIAIYRGDDEWLCYYKSQNYYPSDPLHREARKRDTPFVMTEIRPENDTERLIMAERAELHLQNGLVVPIRPQGELPALCVMHAGENDVDPKSLTIAHSMAVFTYAAVNRLTAAAAVDDRSRLTPRERECLLFVARGKSDWEIGELLSLSERTVHHAVERAKRRLGVSTRVQAIVRAIHDGEISTNEVMD